MSAANKIDKYKIDFTVFKNLDLNQCTNAVNDYSDNISNCHSLQRIASSLKYYDLACNNKISKDDFCEFCQRIYPNVLDDYCHLIDCHNYQLIQIQKELKLKYSLDQCKINRCKIMIRRCRLRQMIELTDNDNLAPFHIDTFDRLHHHIFHLDQLGFRNADSKTSKESVEIVGVDDQMVDAAFKRTKERVYAKRSQFRDIERYENKHNKVNISVQENIANSGLLCTSCFHVI